MNQSINFCNKNSCNAAKLNVACHQINNFVNPAIVKMMSTNDAGITIVYKSFSIPYANPRDLLLSQCQIVRLSIKEGCIQGANCNHFIAIAIIVTQCMNILVTEFWKIKHMVTL